LDGLLADIIPQDARGKVQANYTAAGLIGNLIGATAAGLLYGYSTGLPFLIEGLFDTKGHDDLFWLTREEKLHAPGHG
jgi:hypothetical protein